eukprot:jgi/Chlat1/6550/Chrsp45S06021
MAKGLQLLLQQVPTAAAGGADSLIVLLGASRTAGAAAAVAAAAAALGGSSSYSRCQAPAVPIELDSGKPASTTDKFVEADFVTRSPNHYLVDGTKDYAIHQKPIFSAVLGWEFCWILVRNVTLQLVPILEQIQPVRREDDDEEVLEVELPDVDWSQFAQGTGRGALRDVTTSTVRRALERVAEATLSKRLAHKLLKDVSISAKRKFHMSAFDRLYAAARIPKTVLRGHALAVLSALIVQETMEIVSAVQRHKRRQHSTHEQLEHILDERLPLFVRRTLYNVARSLSVLVVAAVSASVGTLLKPGFGTTLGIVLAEVIVSWLFGHYVEPWLLGPPPSDGAGDGQRAGAREPALQ